MISLAIPSPKAFIDATVRVFGCLFARELFLHARHTGAERVSPAAALGLGRLQVHALFFGRCSALGVQATTGILAFFALPCCGFSHSTP